MGSDQAVSLPRYDCFQHSLNFAKRLYPAVRSLTTKHWLSRIIPLFTLTRGAKRILENSSAVLSRASVVAFSNIRRYRPDRRIKLTGDFCSKRMSSEHFSICERRLEQLLCELIDPHSLERISHEEESHQFRDYENRVLA